MTTQFGLVGHDLDTPIIHEEIMEWLELLEMVGMHDHCADASDCNGLMKQPGGI